MEHKEITVEQLKKAIFYHHRDRRRPYPNVVYKQQLEVLVQAAETLLQIIEERKI